jgi:FAD/FMN-containing dehydrogenase
VTHPTTIENFGRSIRLHPQAYYEPTTEQDVLTILDRHRGEQIRAIGRLHSWSEAPGGDGVVLNLKHLQQIQVDPGDATAVVAGAGCQIKTLVGQLKRQGRTLPSLGLINEQTIAGAISTGTHGSGRHSLSHYVLAVRVARYDAATGAAVIDQIDQGDELLAARCSLGCLGIVLSVTMQCRPVYRIEEHLREYATLEEVLEAEAAYPLQQFFVTPWRWTCLAQHRREVTAARSWLAPLYRWYWFLTIDLGLHLIVLTTLRVFGSFWAARILFRQIIPHSVIRGWKVTDDSAAMLVMEHELFRHIEMEVFVTREHLPASLQYVRSVLTVAGSASKDLPDLSLDKPNQDRLAELRGCYGHHYPICIRRVMPDQTLISMASGETSDWYAISLISYARPTERQGFRQVMTFLAATMSRRFNARLHWGKFCPLTAAELASHYSRFRDFQTICRQRDPGGVFRNKWMTELLAGQTTPE